MKQIFNLIIVDESGSMSLIRKQAFTGMNETLQTIRGLARNYPETQQRVTLMVFSTERRAYIYNNVPAEQTHDLEWKAYDPCGGTPLYDAMGESISRLNAMTTDEDHVLVTVITDGEENCSREWKLEMIKKLIEKLKKQNWTFTLIGTDNLDVESMAGSMAIDEHLSFSEDAEGTEKMFAEERAARCCYNMDVREGRKREKGKFFKR